MNVKIVIATHKEYSMPNSEQYLPVHAGSSLANQSLPYQRDDEGDNISKKNNTYCELTALYWAYKNLKADYIGLCHYRRYLDINNIDINRYDVILPKKRHYYIETVYSHFKHAHGSKPLDIVEEVIEEIYPDYVESYKKQMNKRSLHLFNMFVMKNDLFTEYCEFLFTILNKVENQLGNVDRLYGYLGERLLDVFLDNKAITVKEVGMINTEPINWCKKILNFLKRKYQ